MNQVGRSGWTRDPALPTSARLRGYLGAVASVAGATMLLYLLRRHLDRPDAALVYLLAVVLAASSAGVGPGILAAALGFVAWNYFLIGPAFSFSVERPRDWFTLGVFLVVGVITGELAGRARERAAEAAAVAQLRAADELKTAVLAAVSHDLKSPLASIMASIANLRRRRNLRGFLPDDDESLAALEAEAKRLSALVSDLLDLSRLEAGAWKPAREWYDLSDLLGTVLGQFEERAADRVEIHLAGDLPMIQVDGVQVAQVLWNLLDNALKYSAPESPVQLAAGVAGADLKVTVADHGPGVPPAERQRIFEPFYRADHLSKRTVPGTGLGLAICRRLVEGHGGRIWMEENRPHGARVVFTLPRVSGSEGTP